MKDSREVLAVLSREHGLDLGEEQVERLLAYEAWLKVEALPAGGIGPNEADRVMDRHIVDSIAMGVIGRRELGSDLEGRALDVGSGVGLPGIPLAIAFPKTQFTLLDRSGRRARLLRRATRVLEMDVEVSQAGVEDFRGPHEIVTSRASLPPPELLPHLRRLTSPAGICVVAGSTTQKPRIDGYRAVEFRSEILGIRRWMLIMRQS